MAVQEGTLDLNRGWTGGPLATGRLLDRNPIPPLVSQETWDRAQLIKKQRTIQSARNTKVFYRLQRMVRCVKCNRVFGCRSSNRTTVRSQGITNIRDRETPRRSYVCYGMAKLGLKCRDHPHIPGDQLEEVVLTEVKRVLQNPYLILAGLKSMDSEDDGRLGRIDNC